MYKSPNVKERVGIYCYNNILIIQNGNRLYLSPL